MSGVWKFNHPKDGVITLNPVTATDQNEQRGGEAGGGRRRRKVLVHLPTGEVVSSYASLEGILTGLGWERYYSTARDLFLQFHKPTSNDLISLPRDFSRFNSVHMYDLVIKNPNIFHVRDI